MRGGNRMVDCLNFVYSCFGHLNLLTNIFPGHILRVRAGRVRVYRIFAIPPSANEERERERHRP